MGAGTYRGNFDIYIVCAGGNREYRQQHGSKADHPTQKAGLDFGIIDCPCFYFLYNQLNEGRFWE